MVGMDYLLRQVKLLLLVGGRKRYNYMKQEDRLILKTFLISPIPQDFLDTTNRMFMIEAIIGLADRAYSGEKLSRNEVNLYELDKDMKKEIGDFLPNHKNNLKFYYLIKLVFMVLNEYSC